MALRGPVQDWVQAGLACQQAVELSPAEASFEERLDGILPRMPPAAAAALQVHTAARTAPQGRLPCGRLRGMRHGITALTCQHAAGRCLGLLL